RFRLYTTKRVERAAISERRQLYNTASIPLRSQVHNYSADMKRLWAALFHSIDGLVAAWRDEAAFRQEVVPAVFLIPLAAFIAPDAVSLVLLIGAILIVLIVELINTAVEAAVNRIGLHRDELAKKAKDAASAAVMLSLGNAVMVWVLVLM
ncbi:MAG: diacylglycerol kinase, partial [Cyanobacteria bacterium J06621_3]